MVPTDRLALFVVASVSLVLVPGPSVGFVVATTLRHGRRAGLAATAGVEVGYLVHVLGAVAGLSAVVVASASAFTAVKVLGAAWLVWLAVRAWRARTPGTLGDAGLPDGGAADAASPGTARSGSPGHATRVSAGHGGRFRAGLLVGALNPKTAVFFLAFLPQFVVPAAGPVWLQLLELGLVFIGLAWVLDSVWCVAGGALRDRLPGLRLRVLDRVSAGVYAALAAVTLTARRAAA
ncbi:LysE family translocator [Cellulomonas cellasea]|uniref:Threonine/homoserine/homoserine lactone efflux protein n=1 Tax=Cellulomonas cellasea TaxID=43670 RepID=A0A7W4YDR5_9CELL|nr:LysE family translocator [Cellulomonas cellasea]MBB2925434.1 threonine/homoserine/homoserine lactone efflux protein [Cellulomonas cellasea]